MSSKFVEEIGKMSVMDLAKLVKELEEAFGVSAAAPAGVAAPAAAGAAPVAAAEEKNELKVVLKEAGTDKIKVIKALRVVAPTLSLGAAKEAVENVPFVVAESAPKDEAKKMQKTLEEAGAKVELA